MLKSEFKTEKNKKRERKRRGKGEEKQSRRRGGERGARLRETEWTAHLQTLQKSTNTCKEAPQFKWIATAEKKKEKKKKEKKIYRAETKILQKDSKCHGFDRPRRSAVV